MFDRSTLVRSAPSFAEGTNAHQMRVGTIELNASPALVGRNFLANVGGLIAGLVFEFFLLAAALAFIFHRTLTRPLLRYADQLSASTARGHCVQSDVLPDTNAMNSASSSSEPTNCSSASMICVRRKCKRKKRYCIKSESPLSVPC